ncbi:MAG TPA: mechanosensitive ion channel protein MscS [Flavobacteriales bacterium]|nr:mechanosensitive ion channel protein MscS [Flavobacteriales bacterium]
MEEYQVQLIESAIVIFGYIVSRSIVKRVVDAAAKKYEYPLLRIKVTLKIFNIIFFLLFASFMLFIWGVDQNELAYFVTSLLTVVGVAFLAQWSILSNITASLVIFFNHPVRIGDSIVIVEKDFNIEGRVIDIGIFFLIIENEEGNRITFPTNFFLQKLIKLSKTEA